MGALFNKLKYKIRYGSTVEWYNMLYLMSKRRQKVIPVVKSIEDTIDAILSKNASVSRFGDGEMLIVGGKPIRFQKHTKELEEKLKEVLQSDHEDHLVCLSDTFENLDRYTRSAKRFWRTHFYLYGYLWDKYLRKDMIYYNTFLTRPYMDYKDKGKCGIWFESLKKIWEERDVVLIEGQKSRLGYGNDLFSNAGSIKRILCPPRDAFDCYGQILDAACELDKNHLFLVALGPTATALAYDLYKKGYQAIDAGHVDIEYEWYRMGAKRKVPIPSKYVNESPGGDKAGSDLDEVYKSEIIRIIE